MLPCRFVSSDLDQIVKGKKVFVDGCLDSFGAVSAANTAGSNGVNVATNTAYLFDIKHRFKLSPGSYLCEVKFKGERSGSPGYFRFYESLSPPYVVVNNTNIYVDATSVIPNDIGRTVIQINNTALMNIDTTNTPLTMGFCLYTFIYDKEDDKEYSYSCSFKTSTGVVSLFHLHLYSIRFFKLT